MPFVYYIPEQDTEAMQKPMDAERLLRCLGASGKLAGFPCAAYMVEQVREDPERIRLITKRLYRETARKFRISGAAGNSRTEVSWSTLRDEHFPNHRPTANSLIYWLHFCGSKYEKRGTEIRSSLFADNCMWNKTEA